MNAVGIKPGMVEHVAIVKVCIQVIDWHLTIYQYEKIFFVAHSIRKRRDLLLQVILKSFSTDPCQGCLTSSKTFQCFTFFRKATENTKGNMEKAKVIADPDLT